MIDSLEGTLKNLEVLRVGLMLEQNERTTYSHTRIKRGNDQFFQPIMINHYPIFQFRYEGAMPLYDEKDKKYIALVRDYYYQVTLTMYEYPEIDIFFENAVLIIQHVFSNEIIRDLDNRNRKYLIDAIRHTGLIVDDSFMNLSIIEEGFVKKGCSPYVNVFLLDRKNLVDFFSYKNDLALQDKSDFKNVIKWDEVKLKLEKEEAEKLAFEEKFGEEMDELF